MKPAELRALEAAMIRAAHAAGAVLRARFGRIRHVREKRGAGLVTEVDLAAEAAAMRVLRRARKDFGILTEETGAHQAGRAGRFVLDPLDGTTNYIHGFPMFCVSIGAEWEGELVAGVIHHPILDETYHARRGGGAYVNRKRIRVSGTRRLRDSLLTTGFTYRKDEWLHAEMQPFERLSAVARAVRRPGSAALDLAYTARGVFDGFWERRLSPWDVAAGAVIVREAGGKVTGFDGAPFRIDGQEVLASNPALHGQLVQVLTPEVCELPAQGRET
jgi:myo-inositol-1(or 4)-monophosphatase